MSLPNPPSTLAFRYWPEKENITNRYSNQQHKLSKTGCSNSIWYLVKVRKGKDQSKERDMMPFRLKKNIKPNCLLKHSINTELNWSSFYLIQSIATWGIFNHLNLCIFVFLGLFLAIFAKQVKKKKSIFQFSQNQKFNSICRMVQACV